MVVAALNPKNGDLNFEAMIKSFVFLNPQIQEQFNGNEWMESDRYPKALFLGRITNFSEIDLGHDSTYRIQVSGSLTMHGMIQPVSSVGTITVKGKRAKATCSFSLKLEDYNIHKQDIPTITVSANF